MAGCNDLMMRLATQRTGAKLKWAGITDEAQLRHLRPPGLWSSVVPCCSHVRRSPGEAGCGGVQTAPESQDENGGVRSHLQHTGLHQSSLSAASGFC